MLGLRCRRRSWPPPPSLPRLQDLLLLSCPRLALLGWIALLALLAEFAWLPLLDRLPRLLLLQ